MLAHPQAGVAQSIDPSRKNRMMNTLVNSRVNSRVDSKANSRVNGMNATLTTTQYAELSADLQTLLHSLSDLLSDTEAGVRPVKLKDNSSRLSRMDEMHNQSILRANRNLTANRLIQINAALERLAQGTYGLCSACDEPVAFNRLKAYPETTMCLPCKSAAEHE
jgi:DnaK suppressor protein